MKILCVYTPSGPEFVRNGWGHVFDYMGHEFIFWDMARKPAFDMFDELEPDIFIGTTYDLDRATIKCIKTRPEMKVILFGSAHGPLLFDIDQKAFPVHLTEREEFDKIKRLKDETGQPEFVFIHHHPNLVSQTMSSWEKIAGVKYLGIMNAADTFDYYDGCRDEALECDLAFVGGYWDYKARNLDRFLLPLCASGDYSIKIFGNKKWPVAQYGGLIPTKMVKNLFSSAKICPNVSEPHSTVYGFDVIERPFKVLSSGGFCISDYVKSADENNVFGGHLPMAESPEEFREMIDHYLKNEDERNELAEKGRRHVLKHHTYFHRVAIMLENIGMKQEAEKCMEMYTNLIGV